VAVPFSVVQQVCGQYDQGRCRARDGAPCESSPCPFLRRDGDLDAEPARRARPDEVDRRALVLGGAAVATVGLAGLAAAGLAAGIGRAVGDAPAEGGGTATLRVPSASGTTTPTAAPPTTSGTGAAGTSTTTSPAEPAGKAVGAAADVPVGGAARFTDPGTGDPSLVLQLDRGSFLAYDAICPHEGCTVGYSTAAKLIVCPCHGSEFNPATGAVLAGPAPRGLTAIPIQEGADGELYVT